MMAAKASKIITSSYKSFCDYLRISPDGLEKIILGPDAFIDHKFSKTIKGKKRDFLVPNTQLAGILKKIDRLVKKQIPLPSYVYGWVKGKSSRKNALLHAGAEYLFTTDIESFFPNISQQKISDSLVKSGFNQVVSTKISLLTTFGGILPHGYHSSPTLANVVFIENDRRLYRLAKKNHFVYSRCGDDISLSGERPVYPLMGTISAIVRQSGFILSKKKTINSGPHDKKVITKLVVNSSPRPEKKYVSNLKNDIRSLWEGGVGLAKLSRQNGMSPKRMIKNIWGRLHYVKSSNPKLYRAIRGLLVKARTKLDIAPPR